MERKITRAIKARVLEACDVFPVVAIFGARQVGKSTLVKMIGEDQDRFYTTLDDLGTLESALTDPHGFIDSIPKPVTIDEIQKAPMLLPAMKKFVDGNKRAGDFIITGSSRFEASQKIKESLAGRISMIELKPMTKCELESRSEENPIDTLFRFKTTTEMASFFNKKSVKGGSIDDLVLTGGFPTPALELDQEKRHLWFEQYRKTYIEQDVPNILTIQEIPTFLRFISVVASSSGKPVNLSDMARDTSISVDTVRRWLNVMKLTFLAESLLPWWVNIRKRIAKSSKIYLSDSGLLAHLLGVESWNEAINMNIQGQLLETWFYQQMSFLCQTSSKKTELFFFRTYSGIEVDFILARMALIVAVELKNSKTITKKDWSGLERYLEMVKKAHGLGILVYRGNDIIPISNNIVAIPLEKIF